jgi:hypothetical protein
MLILYLFCFFAVMGTTLGGKPLNSELQCVIQDQSSMPYQHTLGKCMENTETENIKSGDNKSYRFFCFSVWGNNSYPGSNSLTMISAGCINISHQSVANSGCAQEECEGVYRNSDGNTPVVFCCCNTTSCNDKYSIATEQAVSTKPYPLNNNAIPEDTRTLYLLVCVGVVSIISILGLSWCLIAQHRTPRLDCLF